MKKICNIHSSVMSLWFLFLWLSSCIAKGQDGSWRVWVKVSPCSGRFDWITVAQNNPTGGINFYYQANVLFPGTNCTLTGCTFQQATAVATSLSTSNEFFKYCCRDYSVWQNTQTRQMTVVIGKFGTAGYGWQLVKADLCCEEAEALSGIQGACSKATTNNNTQCWPGSYAAFNPQTNRTECFCKAGLVWNSTKTACVEPEKKADCSMYAGSYAAWNEQNKRMECWCPQGKTWNSTKTACVDIATQVSCWPGSYAAFNPQTNRTECFCNQGLVWNSTKTACVEPEKKADCSMYAGSYAAWNEQNKRMECWCPQGKTWNSTKTACVDIATQASCWPGSYAAFNPQTNRTECFCNQGLVWNSTKTACVQPGTTNTTTTTGGSGTWTLVSVTSYPTTPSQGWSFNAQSGTAHMDVYNGDKADFRWTPPPPQFNSTGFTIALSTTGTPAPNSRIASLIGVAGDGLTTDSPSDQRSAYATPPTGPASAQQSVTFKPSTSSSEIQVRVELMWGSVKVYYKYQKTP